MNSFAYSRELSNSDIGSRSHTVTPPASAIAGTPVIAAGVASGVATAGSGVAGYMVADAASD